MKLQLADPAPRMVLRSTVTSPYGRKVRMAILVHGLQEEIDIVPADTLDQSDTLRAQNPLGKIPCLLMPDGSVVFDSRVIIECLDNVSSGPPLVPLAGPERIAALTSACLCDGVIDAAILMVYEGRFRDASQRSQRWMDHQSGKINRALTVLAANLPPVEHTNLTTIGLACALSYLDWRKPVEWREHYPELVQWLANYSAFESAVAKTAAT